MDSYRVPSRVTYKTTKRKILNLLFAQSKGNDVNGFKFYKSFKNHEALLNVKFSKQYAQTNIVIL